MSPQPPPHDISKQDEQPASDARIQAPSIQLPKGGGAIRSIGEKFTANPVTGTGSITVPIATSPGRSGFGPQLMLSYDSGAGNGPFGVGWSISIPRITRKTDRGLPRYRDGEAEQSADTFILSDAEDLIPVLVQDATGWRADARVETEGADIYTVRRYRPRTEGLFARIERWKRATTGESHWRSVSKDSVTSIYGRGASCRIADPAQPTRVFAWLLEESRDDRGNIIRYDYKVEDNANVDPALPHERNRLIAQANRYLKRITYGNRTPNDPSDNVFEIVLDYGDHAGAAPTPTESRTWPCRLDPFSNHRAGFEVRTRRLCRRVLVFHRFAELGTSSCLVRSTDFTYDERPDFTHLIAVTLRGYVARQSAQALPPLEFTYTAPVMTDAVRFAEGANLPEGVDGGRYRWVDLDGEGLTGVLTEQAGAWHYARNQGGGHFAPARAVAARPSLAELNGGRQQFLDLDGDGRLHLAQLDGPIAGYYARDGDDGAGGADRDDERGWAGFRTFPSLPRLAWNDPNLRFLDVDGDGLADVVLTDDEVFTWYRSRGHDGFEAAERTRKPIDEERGPTLLFADASESIQLADMDGDGLTDIVRIRPGEVCYWPNLGYGRFGPKVTMAGAPTLDHPDRFQAGRLRLADIDGSGTTDLVYLEGDHARYWINQAGNGWSAARQVPSFPATDSLSSVTVTDLLGSGTACLVWSSPLPGSAGRPLRYLDLMGGQKPHLLRTVTNNLGGETRIEYAPSTHFYLEDREAGQPWVTRLPFPVQVVTRVEALDQVTGARLVTRYAYHHGYYDGAEREFRGFGRVDQWDAESFAGAPGQTLDQPPAHTRTWFHTGAWIDGQSLTRRYGAEFWDGDAAAWPLPDSSLPPGLSPVEEREAHRALRGRMLRQEVYAEDGVPDSVHPYSVAEHSYEVVCLQPRAGGGLENRHAVFFAHDLETLTYHYERNPADPRVQHAMTLRVDAFGNVLESAAIGYARRAPGAPALDEQARTYVTCTRNSFVNRADQTTWYRIGVPVETRTYEITGLARAPASPFTLATLLAGVASATEIAYEVAPTPDRLEKRSIEGVRHLYYRDDLTGPLPLGQIERLALPYEAYGIAFTAGLVAQVYGTRVTDSLLQDEGKYWRWPGETDGLWWRRSGRQELDPARFFLPVAFVDPWGNRSRVEYDPYALLVTATYDALPAPLTNVVQARTHYRTLQPWQVIDPNGNRNAVRFDALGMITATAVMGKPGAGEGDSLDETTIEESAADDPTSRLSYDLFAWRDRRQPCYVRTEVREEHAASTGAVAVVEALISPDDSGGPPRPPTDEPPPPPETTRWQISLSYSDGAGHEVLKKIQAEPGLAPMRDSVGNLIRDTDGKPVLQYTATRWVGTGRLILNNKGNPVKRYEPYFMDDAGYDTEADLVEHGVTPVLHYDPLGRTIRVDQPNGTFTRVEFSPWEQATWDENDTVLESRWYAERRILLPGDPERRAAALAAALAGTPGRAYLDSLSRSVVTVAQSGPATLHQTRTTLDVEGNQRALTDARGNAVLLQTFDVLGRKILVASADAGERRVLLDVEGKTLRTWHGTGSDECLSRHVHDAVDRPTHRWIQIGNGPESLVERTVYGEAHPEAVARNLKGQVFHRYDPAGVVTSERHDFKGNVLQSSRRLTRQYRTRVDWRALGGLTDIAAIESAAEPELEAEAFLTSTTFDALNRPTRLTSADSSAIVPAYNEANLLEAVSVFLRGATTDTVFVANIDYDAKGQREQIAYGSGVRTAYTYDPQTYRLTRVLTTRPATNTTLQDLRYTYDPVGNPVEVHDDAQQTVYFDNAVVPPHLRYEYDALYRLVRAQGREHASLDAPSQPDELECPSQPLPHPNDAQALRNYVEVYTYDLAGNIAEMLHQSGGLNIWRRRYQYAADRNRLLATSQPGDPLDGLYSRIYTHDGFGNMTSMPHLSSLTWDEDDQLQQVDLGGGGTAYYVYNGEGQRVRKVIERQGSLTEERIYLGGFEIFRRRTSGGGLRFERQTLHVMDGQRRIALVETKTLEDGAPVSPPESVIRYQLDNHLGSAIVELDGAGLLLSYEEYSPYGETSYHSARGAAETSLKRYRYTGKERDDETRLYYYGARYYIPWLGRWTSCDPGGLVDGPNLYTYVQGNPIRRSDRVGHQGFDSQELMMSMMWHELGQEISAIMEGFIGGRAYVDPAANRVEYSGPQGGVGGVAGGVVRAASLRTVPIERHPSDVSLMGMDLGAELVPIINPADKLLSGTTVTGQEANRKEAALQLALDVLPYGVELHGMVMERRAISLAARAGEAPASIVLRPGIGAGNNVAGMVSAELKEPALRELARLTGEPIPAYVEPAGIGWSDAPTAPPGTTLYAVGPESKVGKPLRWGAAQQKDMAGYVGELQWSPTFANQPGEPPLILPNDPVTGAPLFTASDRPVGLYQLSATTTSPTPRAMSRAAPQLEVGICAPPEVQFYTPGAGFGPSQKGPLKAIVKTW